MSAQQEVRAQAREHGWTHRPIGSTDYFVRNDVQLRVSYTTQRGVRSATVYDVESSGSPSMRPGWYVLPGDRAKLATVLGWLEEKP